jgi:cellulose synthase/poly-beta-1,6-N-acetylglucosamine synthase-like glycosyltransferase
MFLLFAGFSVVFAITYAWLIGFYRSGWRRLPEWIVPVGFQPVTTVSVVVPARNEAKNIVACLEAVRLGGYPAGLLEIIVVDDHSTDLTAALAAAVPGTTVLRLADYADSAVALNSYKKKALETGIASARGELIVTTDADCVAAPGWLPALVSAYAHGEVNALCGPVLFFRETNQLQRFQALDFLGMMGITGAGIHLEFHQMGNGANLAFPKRAFEAVGGYSGADHLASGDDMFLLQKIAARFPGTVVFVKSRDAVVQTEAMPDLRSLIRQRVRWGTKNAALPDWKIRIALGMVLVCCWSIWVNTIVALVDQRFLFLLLFQLALKAVADWFFLREMCRYFRRTDLLRYFWPSFFLHVWYIAWVGVLSLCSRNYMWKDRIVK